MFAKYVPPVVANGKVYVPNFGPVGNTDGSGNLVAYGLLQQLTVNVANATMTTGLALPTLTGAVVGLVNGDKLGTTIVVTYSTTANSSSPAGTYPITATVTGSSAGNYGVVVNAGTRTITPAPTLTVTASNATRTYGTANPTFSGTVTGAQNGDTFTESFATTATTTSAVGTYPVVPAVTGSDLADYTVTIVNGALTVTAAATTTTLTAPGSVAYGASETLMATVASTAGTPGGTVTFSSRSTALGTGTAEQRRRGHTDHEHACGGHRFCHRYIRGRGQLCRQHLGARDDHRHRRASDTGRQLCGGCEPNLAHGRSRTDGDHHSHLHPHWRL
jgi:MBG domain (YGX type)